MSGEMGRCFRFEMELFPGGIFDRIKDVEEMEKKLDSLFDAQETIIVSIKPKVGE